MTLRSLCSTEHLYCYSQSQKLSDCCGRIGHLRVDFDNGHGFFTSWNWHKERSDPDAFTKDLGRVLRRLRTDRRDGFLKDLATMRSYCRVHPTAILPDEDPLAYGFRVDTELFSYLIRCIPEKGSYNAYVYCYDRLDLNAHMLRAANGIEFIDSDYHPLFRLRDGGLLTLRYPNGQTLELPCRYVDERHVDIGLTLRHTCQFAELCEDMGIRFSPKDDTQLLPGERPRNHMKEAR